MSIELIKEYIDPQLFIIIPMIWGIGMALSRSRIKRDFIPIILLICSCLVVILHLISTKMIFDSKCVAACLFAGVTQGSVIWLFAWTTYEKFLKEKKD